MEKIALFIDWDNLSEEISFINRKLPHNLKFDRFNIHKLHSLFNRFIDRKEEKLYRIFFYSAYPLNVAEIKEIVNHKYKNDHKMIANFNKYLGLSHTKHDGTTITQEEKMGETYLFLKSFLDSLAKKPYMAMRIGKLKINKLDSSGSPIFAQKQVDMLMGLDIAHVSHHRLTDRILVFCKDTDIVPALKEARVNGIQTLIAHLKEGFPISYNLVKHNDIIRRNSLKTIITQSQTQQKQAVE